MKSKKTEDFEGNTGELVNALQSAQRQILSLENQLDEYRWLEESLRKRTKDLNERVKELECLYAVSNSLPSANNLAELLLSVCETLPKGFQFPASSWVSIEVYGQKFTTRGFRPSVHRIARDIQAHGETVGGVSVCIGPVFDRDHKHALLPEEERLVEMVAAMLGKLLESKLAD
jgi:nitrate/nitrite-specific signal transduction histidine kinase